MEGHTIWKAKLKAAESSASESDSDPAATPIKMDSISKFAIKREDSTMDMQSTSNLRAVTVCHLVSHNI